jgi:hypothetical protein
MNTDGIEEALQLLNRRLVYAGESYALAICGGAALLITGLVRRVTHDVDVLALVTHEPGAAAATVELIDELPAPLVEQVSIVGAHLGIGEEWLNAGPSILKGWGFPEGMSRRLIRRRYGDGLCAFFLHRLDQIHFKVLAAMDPSDGIRHLRDLIEIQPARSEAESAAGWLLARPTGAEFRKKLAEVLERLGHGHDA